MISARLKCDLEADVVGQPRAVDALVRSATIALSGLAKDAAPLATFLFIGPSGTGKSHVARALCRRLHGGEARLIVADCSQLAGREPGERLARMLAPCFGPRADVARGILALPPLTIMLFERLERARPELVTSVLSAIETGGFVLPDGDRGSLCGAIVLLTSNLCAREIWEAGRQEIGFSSAALDLADHERARVYRQCAGAAERAWGPELLGQLDDIIVFHPLRREHLPHVLARLTRRLEAELGQPSLTFSIEPSAESFLLERTEPFLRHGAWALVRAFRRFVVFPLADLIATRRPASGTSVVVDRDPAAGDRLRFRLTFVKGPPPGPPRTVSFEIREGAATRRVGAAGPEATGRS